MALGTSPQPDRFFDGGTDTEPPDRAARPRIVLERRAGDSGANPGGAERFRMLRRIGYDDAELGPIIVPADLDRASTDLASVPSVFTWLVPRSGRHLPAALVHDGLVDDPRDTSGAPDAPDASEATDHRTPAGRSIDRATADRVFRDAMRDGGTGLVRRWLVWSAVTLATIAVGVRSWSAARRWRYRLPAAATLLIVAVLGTLATLDLVDVADDVVALPWMGDRPWPEELLGGAAAALVVPLLLALTWGRFAVAGAVVGVATAFLLHVTVVVAALTVGYQGLERVVARWPLAALTGATVLVGASMVVLVLVVAGG